MVPNVTVPMNFGKDLLLSPTHNNIVLNTSKDMTVSANSVILSFNSPVIGHLTGTLHLTSVDMLEFDREAVQLFVEAAYSGTVEGLTRALFRDINKICKVFKVDWMLNKCLEFLTAEAKTMTTASYTDLLFLFEEAAYIFEMQKSRDLVDVALRKIEMLQYKKEFIDQYLENVDRLSTMKLDLVIELAGSEVNYIVQTLTNQLTQQTRVQGPPISANCRYLLDNSGLHLCKKSNRELFDKLFCILEDLSTDFDTLKWVLQLHKKAHLQQEKEVHSTSTTVVPGTLRSNKIPNLYQNINMKMSYDQFVIWLCTSEDITNVLLAVEAVITWINYQYKPYGKCCTPSQRNTLLDMIAGSVNTRGWFKLPYSLRGRYMRWFFNLLDPYCVSEGEQLQCGYVVVDCIDTCDKPLTFLSGEGRLIFHFKPPGVTSCKRPGHCGFILKTIPSAGALRTLELCTESKDYDNTSVHFHDSVRAENMHIFCCDTNNDLCSLSWFGWSHSSNTSSNEMEWWKDKFFNRPPFKFRVLYLI